MKILGLVSLLLVFTCTACTVTQVQNQVVDGSQTMATDNSSVLSFETDQFGERPDIIAAQDIFQLTREQQKAFLKYLNSPIRQNTPANQRVYDYLQHITMDFSYQGETFTATMALEKSSGNCLSLAILTTALAELANVETNYQLVNSAPVFESQGSVVYKGQHVRTSLLAPHTDGTTGTFLLRRSGLLVDYFPTEGSRFVSNISAHQYIAMYYNNLASEAIAKEDYNTAYWLLRKTLELTPDDAGPINTMAVIHRRVGDLAKAEEIYLYGIEHLDDKVSLLRNYRVLLEQQGRLEEVAQINRRLTVLDDPSPFDWMYAGHNAYEDGNFEEAILFYRRASKIAPYLHESYAGLARSYYMTGKHEDAERELNNALQNSYRGSTRSLYEAKLIALTQHL